jgi:lipopolysaccharide biosynthesis glycosyltransferase
MKYLVVTRADNNIKGMTDITFPIIKKFCKEWNADFMALDHIPDIMTDDNHPHYRIMKIYDLLNDYDRVVSLDSDMIINKSCPNLFNIVPEDCVGSIFEDVGTRANNRKSKIQKIQKKYGDLGWEIGYVNTGLMVVSKMHREIFTPINGSLYTEDGSDDLHIGYQIHKLGFKIYELDYRFNHMTMFSEPECGSKNRFDSFIIHYAGVGIFDKDIRSRIDQINRDAKIIY